MFALFDEAFKPSLMGMLRTIDFTIFTLTPVSSRYVVGFGLAFDTDLQATYFNQVTVDKDKKAGIVK